MIFKNKGRVIDLHIGPRLKRWRLINDVSQIDMAKKSDVLQHTLSKIEAESVYPSKEILFKICKAYDIDYIWLITGVDIEKLKKL